jgi:hypothetical protein
MKSTRSWMQSSTSTLKCMAVVWRGSRSAHRSQPCWTVCQKKSLTTPPVITDDKATPSWYMLHFPHHRHHGWKFKRSLIKVLALKSWRPLCQPPLYYPFAATWLSSEGACLHEVDCQVVQPTTPSRAKRDIKKVLTCMQNGAVGNTLSMVGMALLQAYKICLGPEVWTEELSLAWAKMFSMMLDMILPTLVGWS